MAYCLYLGTSPSGSSLVFAPPEVAESCDRMHRALKAGTWGEVRAILDEREFSELCARMAMTAGEDDEAWCTPADAAPFDAESVPGFSDGDYPPWLQSRMDQWIPAGLFAEYADRRFSVVNESFWEIGQRWKRELVVELGLLGIEVIERPDLKFW